MSRQWPGSLIRKTPVTPSGNWETASAKGLWTLAEALFWRKQSNWPTAGITAPGEAVYTTPGTYTWIVPAGVTSVTVLVVGAGQGGAKGSISGQGSPGRGGGLIYKNNQSVTPGQSCTVTVGAGGIGTNTQPTNGGLTMFQWISGSGYIAINADGSPSPNGTASYYGGSPGSTSSGCGGGGGAAGYSGNGGNGGSGANGYPAPGNAGNNGTGGGGGGGGGGGAYSDGDSTYYLSGGNGGGVGLYGQGSSGAGGAGGSQSQSGSTGGYGSSSQFVSFGAGGGGGGRYIIVEWCGCCPRIRQQFLDGGQGGNGAVRILWSGGSSLTRAFPSTNVGVI